MDGSTVTTSSKESKRTSKVKKLQRSDDLLTESNDNCKPCIKASKTRAAWKSFFNLFTKTSANKMSTKSLIPKEVPDDTKDVYLSDINDEFALAICLPENINGTDVKVDIELEAIKKIDSNSAGNIGLKLLKATLSKTTFCGSIKCPSNINIDNISKMPLYFVSAAVITHTSGYKTQRIETIIKPLKDNLPRTIDKDILVSDIKLVIHLQNLKKIKRSQILKRCKYLNYTFIQNERKAANPSLQNFKTDEIIEEIVESDKSYNEESKNIVKDILNHVVSKVQAQDISTQYSKLVTTVSKEIDVQKSLLLKNSEIDTEAVSTLSQICEKDEIDSLIEAALKTSYETLYPRSSTSLTAKESALDTDSSIFYLKVPHNTPDTIHAPRYVIKYDSLLSIPEKKIYQNDAKRSVTYENTKHINHISIKNRNYILNEEIKADIDETLELLERAKYKLLGYLDMSFEQNNFEPKANERPKINDHLPTPPKNELQQFFLEDSKKSETPSSISFSNENLAPINTIQNIYNSTYGGKQLELTNSETDRESTWKNRYSGDNHEINQLAYSIVENDINLMIMDLLKESKIVKELAICNMEEDAFRDVKYILELLLTKTEESIDVTALVGNLQAPPNILSKEQMSINYCILDQTIQGDEATTLLDQPKLFESPTVSVKQITGCHKNNDYRDDSLVERLERGCTFLTEIYREICVNEIFYNDNDFSTRKTSATIINDLEDFITNQADSAVVNEAGSSCVEDKSNDPKPALCNEQSNPTSFITNALNNIQYEFGSMQELNNTEEMDYIEENLKHNDNIDSDDEDTKKNKKPFVRRSVESITPVVTDSESSIELNTNEEFKIKQ